MGEVDVAVPSDRAIKTRYRGRDTQHRHNQKEPRAFHSALRIERSAPQQAVVRCNPSTTPKSCDHFRSPVRRLGMNADYDDHSQRNRDIVVLLVLLSSLPSGDRIGRRVDCHLLASAQDDDLVSLACAAPRRLSP